MRQLVHPGASQSLKDNMQLLLKYLSDKPIDMSGVENTTSLPETASDAPKVAQQLKDFDTMETNDVQNIHTPNKDEQNACNAYSQGSPLKVCLLSEA